MRKATLCALMISLPLLLSSCSVMTGTDDILKIQEDFSASENISFTAELTADYGQHLYEYRISFDGLPDSGTITIIEPESIAGTQVAIEDGASSLCFDGAQIYTGEILPDGLSPVDAVPMLLEAWRTGLVTECAKESFDGEDCLNAVFRITDDVNLRTWFGFESGLPLYAEVDFDGYTVISCTFYNVIA
ncbi:MAG: hypothetical protein ACI3VB_03545 [Oscillospiraceae bacterium]